MTIDEAIAHCLEVAEKNETTARRIGQQYEGTLLDRDAKECRECAADHRQLAEWLTELKELRGLVAASNVLAKDVLAVDTLCKQILEYKRLLKLALQDLAEADHCGLCKHEPDDIATCQRKPINCFVWRYADEAEKLLKQ